MDAHQAIMNFLLAAKKAEKGGASLNTIAAAAQDGIYDLTDHAIIDVFTDATRQVEDLEPASEPAQD